MRWISLISVLLQFSQLFGVDFVDLISHLVFLGYISPFNICCKVDLVILNSLNFCLFDKLLISPSILNEIFARHSNLVCRFFPFRQAKVKRIQCHQASFTTNVKGTYIVKKYKRRKKIYRINPKQLRKWQ